MNRKTAETLGKAAGLIAIFIILITTIWWAFYFLWNTIAAGVFGAPELSFWQAVGLLMLIGLITSGLRSRSSSK